MRRTAVLLGMVAALGAGTAVNAAPAGVSTEEEIAIGRRLAPPAPAVVEQPVAAAVVAEPPASAADGPSTTTTTSTSVPLVPALPPVVHDAVDAVDELLDQVPGVTATDTPTLDQIARSRPSQ